MRNPILSLTVLAFACLAATLLRPLPSQCEPRFQPGDPAGAPRGEGDVMQFFDPDGNGLAPAELVIGGSFDDGTGRRSVFAFDGARWRALGTPPAGKCTALGVFGGELIAAVVTSSSPVTSDVAAWNGTSWRVLGAMAGEARCMTAFNGSLVVGGLFASVNGVAAASVVQWNGTSWVALGGGVTGTVHALATFAGVLWAGGDLTRAGGIPVGNLATWNGTAWAASATFNATVRSLAVRTTHAIASSFLFVGGHFSRVGGLTANGVASFNQLSGWAVVGSFPAAGGCETLLVRSTGLFTFELLAGTFFTYRWNGSTWDRLGTDGGDANALASFGGRYVALGSFGILRALDPSGIWVGLSGPGIDGAVAAVAATSSDLVIGGSFSSISGVTHNGIARGRVGAWQPLGSGVLGGMVLDVAVMPNGDVIAGGTFTSAGGTPARRIARWDGSTWSPLGPGLGTFLSDAVYALAVLPDGSLVAGGRFERAGTLLVKNVARWDGSTWTAMGAGLSGTAFSVTVTSLAVRPNGEVLAGGDFEQSGSAPINYLARWNGVSWSAMPGEPDAMVTELATLADGDVLVGGFFSAVGTLPSAYLARWNGSAFAAVSGFTNVPLGYFLQALVPLPDGGALVSGQRLQGNNPGFARYHGQAVTPLPDPLAVFADGTRTSNGEIVFAGDFLRPANVVSAYVVRYTSPCVALADRYGAGCTGSGGPNELTAPQPPVLGTTFVARATGMPAFGLVLGVTGVSQTAIPLASLLRQGLPGCTLLASPDFVGLVPLANGGAESRIPIPASPPLIGQVLHHQLVAFELDAGVNIVAATSTNGLRLTLGTF